jgi:hypothetical protein
VAFAFDATVLELGIFLSLVVKLLAPRPTSLSAQPCPVPSPPASHASRNRLSPTFSFPCPTASFAIPPQLFVSFLASLWLRAAVVGGVGRVGCPALVALSAPSSSCLGCINGFLGRLSLVRFQASGSRIRITCATDSETPRAFWILRLGPCCCSFDVRVGAGAWAVYILVDTSISPKAEGGKASQR